MAVLKPLNNYGIDTRSRIMISIAWISAVICSAPQSYVFHVENHPYHSNYTQCITYNIFKCHEHIYVYTFFCQVFMFFIPLIVIIYCYVSIYREIFQKSQIGNSDRLRRSSIQILGRAKRRTLKMTIVIVIVFIVCWTPYSLITAYFAIDEISARKLNPIIQKCLFLFACTNSCLNPVVYGIYNIRNKSNNKNVNNSHNHN